MCEKEENQIVEVKKDKLVEDSKEIVNKLIDSDNVQESKDLVDLFKLNQVKKEIVRLDANNEIRDEVDKLIKQRIKERPDDLTTKDMLDIKKAYSEDANKLQNTQELISPTTIQINQQNINISNDPIQNLSDESRERLLNFINAVTNHSTPVVVDLDKESKGEDNNG